MFVRRTIVRWAAAAGLAAALAALPACRNAGEPKPVASVAPAATPVVVVHSGERATTFRVELARTNAEHERGLMFRQKLDADAGMLFLFAEPSQQTFWMKNTFIPLDMVFIRADRRVLGVVANAVPQTLDPRFVEGASQYVLEIPGGAAAEHDIGAGDFVELKDIPAP